jgi:dihydrofolate synthase / folylpolyglutamate synthase
VRMPFTLHAIQTVLDRLGNPQQQRPVIHVAGTNGKGSVCALLAAALHATGASVGLTISPHLHREQERIQLNGQPVDIALWQQAQHTVQQADPQDTLSYFERMIAMAFWVFNQQAVDWAIVETGVGGRLDATNTVPHPALTVITSIGLDHQAWLGNTLTEIATEKAGIIKPHVPVVLGPDLPSAAMAVMRTHAQAMQAPVHVADGHRLTADRATHLQASQHWCDRQTQTRFTCPLLGTYQAHNLSVALTALDTLQASGHAVGQLHQWLHGFTAVHWPGRFQILPSQRLILDGSHNADGIRTLCDTLHGWLAPGTPLAVAVSLKANRDPATLAPLLTAGLPIAQVWTMAGQSGYHSAQALAEALRAVTPVAITASDGGVETTTDAVTAWLCAHPTAWGLITGSLYTVGEVMAYRHALSAA